MINIFLEEIVILETDLQAEKIFGLNLLEDEYFLDVELYEVTDEVFIEAKASLPPVDIELSIGTVLHSDGYPLYEGPYEAVPKVVPQNFKTEHKEMSKDFKVKEITYLETSNSGGGITATIGEL